MKIVIAIDSFKGCMTSADAGNAARAGVAKAFPYAEIIVLPLADGGEGTVEAMASMQGAKKRTVEVFGPLGSQRPKVSAQYAVTEDGFAVIESAAAAGLCLLSKSERNPMFATTQGVGQIIKDALDLGIRKFIVGLGGSATNDCGSGLLSVLGARFLNREGKPIHQGCAGLSELARIDLSGFDGRISQCDFRVACDVDNPLLGEFGCTKFFSPQKGAREDDMERMEANIAKFAVLSKQVLGSMANAKLSGAGAAGGMGFAFSSYIGGRLESGARIVAHAIGLEKHLEGASLFITGEGKIDSQSECGKAPVVAAMFSDMAGVPAIAFAGAVEGCPAPIKKAVCINPEGISHDDAMNRINAMKNLELAVSSEVLKFLQSSRS